jgi:sulfur relay protein TusB/DsrH
MRTLAVTAAAPGDGERLLQLRRLTEALVSQGQEVGLLFFADGVCSLVAGSQAGRTVAGLPAAIYAVEADAADRGLVGRLLAGVRLVSHGEAVDLLFAADRVLSYT